MPQKSFLAQMFFDTLKIVLTQMSLNCLGKRSKVNVKKKTLFISVKPAHHFYVLLHIFDSIMLPLKSKLWATKFQTQRFQICFVGKMFWQAFVLVQMFWLFFFGNKIWLPYIPNSVMLPASSDLVLWWCKGSSLQHHSHIKCISS